jgi:protein-S-isoprenylcysteine O-methyltransferase Ste14
VPAARDADALEPGPADGGPAGAHPGILRPPFVYAGSILTGVVLSIVWPLSFVPRALGRPAGGVLALAAVVLFVAAIRQLRAAGTPVPGNRPTTVVVHTGPYRISRNPIYLAFSLLHLGVAAWVGSWWLLATLVASITLIAAVIIPPRGALLGKAVRPHISRLQGLGTTVAVGARNDTNGVSTRRVCP